MSRLVAENDIKDEAWLTLPGDVKIVEQPDAHWNSASMFLLHKEDHTVANLLRMKLHTNQQVRFAAYKVPHPTVADIELVVQTAPISAAHAAAAAADAALGGVPTPAEAVLTAIGQILADLDEFELKWEQNVAPHCQ